MNKFTYSYPAKVYFGEGAAADALKQELPRVGKRVLLACGGGSVKKSGVYDELTSLLAEAGKEVTEFSGIMPNPTHAKVQEGAKLAERDNNERPAVANLPESIDQKNLFKKLRQTLSFFLPLIGEGKHRDDFRPLLQFTVDCNFPLMNLCNPFGDGQPQTGAGPVPGLISPIKPFKGVVSSGLIPIPLSDTDRTQPCLEYVARITVLPPATPYLMLFEIKLMSNCVSRL